jgi:RNA polymerase sigma factor (sigma-70 family)
MSEGRFEEASSFASSELARVDAQLLVACRDGDQAAWATLVARFEGLVCSIPRRAGLDEDSVTEVFQEVFMTLFEKSDEIEQPERLRAWLVTTAKYKSWRLLSKRGFSSQRRVEVEGQGELVGRPDESPLPDEVLIELEEQHLLRTAVAELDERCQTIIKMLFYSDEPCSYEQVAAAIDVGATSISPLRARCLRKLARLLTK